MQNPSPDNGVSLIIASILILAIAITAVAILQLNTVPSSNFDAEADHLENTREEMEAFKSDVDITATTGVPTEAVLRLGVKYPRRILLLNPTPPTGSLTTSPVSVKISNLNATNNETRDYWNGSTVRFDSAVVTYEPRYNYHQSANDVVYENSLVYNYIGNVRKNANVTLSSQDILEGDSIEIVLLNGSINKSKEKVSQRLVPVSKASNSIQVTNQTDESIKLSLGTKLTKDNWTAALSDQESVSDVTDGGNGQVNVTLDQDGIYSLRMADVGLDGGREAKAHYITNAAGNNSTFSEDTGKKIVAEVRDRFNNPVSGVEVNASVSSGGGTVENQKNVTGANGRAYFDYLPPKKTETTARVKLSFTPTPNNLQETYMVLNVVYKTQEERDLEDIGINPSELPDSTLENLNTGGTTTQKNTVSGPTDLDDGQDLIAKNGTDSNIKGNGANSGSVAVASGDVGGNIKNVEDVVLTDGNFSDVGTTDGQVQDVTTLTVDGNVTIEGNVKNLELMTVTQGSNLTVKKHVMNVSTTVLRPNSTTVVQKHMKEEIANVTMEGYSNLTVDKTLECTQPNVNDTAEISANTNNCYIT
ncbi:MAG: hypothetical protein ABEK59_11055 [Halobacteria archaeon]